MTPAHQDDWKPQFLAALAAGPAAGVATVVSGELSARASALVTVFASLAGWAVRARHHPPGSSDDECHPCDRTGHRRSRFGTSVPIQDWAEDADTVMSRVVAMASLSYQQGTILGLEPGISHWPGWESGRVRYGAHAVATHGYYLGGGGYLALADGYDDPRWGADNPYGYDNKVSLSRVWAAMKAQGGGSGDMIW